MQSIYFVDTTLRDGEQSAGVVFNTAEKINIARLLDAVGIHQIEAGIPAMGKVEMEAIEAIMALDLKAKISTWNRANIGDVRASLACGVKNLHISAPVSDIHIRYKLNRSRIWVLESMKRAVSYAKEFDCAVTVGAEDASRADMDFLIRFARLAKEAGATRLRFADTLGSLDPFRTREKVSQLLQEAEIDIEIHSHNDFGMATANALAAYQGGAKYLSTTILGLGERAGNSSFEEVLRGLQLMNRFQVKVNESALVELRNYVATAANRPIEHFRPVDFSSRRCLVK